MSKISFRRDNGEIVHLTADVTPKGNGDNEVTPTSDSWTALNGRELNRAVEMMPADLVLTFRVVIAQGQDVARVAFGARHVLQDGAIENALGEDLGIRVESITATIDGQSV